MHSLLHSTKGYGYGFLTVLVEEHIAKNDRLVGKFQCSLVVNETDHESQTAQQPCDQRSIHLRLSSKLCCKQCATFFESTVYIPLSFSSSSTSPLARLSGNSNGFR